MEGPTVNDIARELDISPSTVSRVLNGSPLVKDQTRSLILETATAMGYRKRRIRRHGPRSILVVALFLPRSPAVSHRLFYDPSDLVAGLDDGFGDVRTQIVVSVNQPRPELFAAKKSGNLDACVFGFTTPSAEVVAMLHDRGIPNVRLNREAEDADYVSTDHLTGMQALLKRLSVVRSRPRICYLSFTPAQPVTPLREEAFLAACTREGVAASRADIIPIHDLAQIDAALLREIASRYDTVFCFNDLVAVYAYQVAILAGIRIPEELSLAGYDNSPVRSLAPQPIDTVTLSPYALGHEAGRWLRARIIDRAPGRLQVRIPGQLVPGRTLCHCDDAGLVPESA